MRAVYASPTTAMAYERGDLVPLDCGWSHSNLGVARF